MDTSQLSNTDANRYREARVHEEALAEQIREVREQLRSNPLVQEARNRALNGWLATALSTPAGLAAIANGHTVDVSVVSVPGRAPTVKFTVESRARYRLNVERMRHNGASFGSEIYADNTLFDRATFTYNGADAMPFEECPELLVRTGL